MPSGIDNPGERRSYILLGLRARMERVSVYHGTNCCLGPSKT
jgi:hypothetical protein